MGRHMIRYHVGVPLAVLAGLLLFGVPLGTAVRLGIAVGCAAMMLMMLGGASHAHHYGDQRRARDDDQPKNDARS